MLWSRGPELGLGPAGLAATAVIAGVDGVGTGEDEASCGSVLLSLVAFVCESAGVGVGACVSADAVPLSAPAICCGSIVVVHEADDGYACAVVAGAVVLHPAATASGTSSEILATTPVRIEVKLSAAQGPSPPAAAVPLPARSP